MTDLTIEELRAYVEAIVGEDFSAPKLLPIRIAEQLIATMQRVEELERQAALDRDEIDSLMGLQEEAREMQADKDFIIRNLRENLVYVRIEGERALQREAMLREALEAIAAYPDMHTAAIATNALKWNEAGVME